MLKINDKVKINFKNLHLEKNILLPIYKFDMEYNGVHTISNVYYKNKFTDKEIIRYELDKEYVFYINELIKI
jgi:hypothetical protein